VAALDVISDILGSDEDVSDIVKEPNEHEVVDDVMQKSSESDDLKRIEGIGPKIAEELSNAGITTFTQLAAMSLDDLNDILEGKVRIFHPDTWSEQAALAADGKWEELDSLQAKLVGGRRVNDEVKD
jgi:predicted flap endonuclease-1-like 5' DNA nuclease